MKRCLVCKSYVRLYLFGSCFILPFIGMVMAFHADGIDVTFDIVMAIVGIGGLLYLLFDYPAYIFAIGKEGVSMRVLFWKWSFSWDEIRECALINAAMAGTATLNLVYFATRKLSPLEKEKFLVETRKDRNHIAFFACDEKFMKKALPLMPAAYARYIKERMRQIGYTT